MRRWTEHATATVAAAAALALARWFADRFQLGPVDDAYISLRYARSWASGDGLVFNAGEQVEGYTNFLWVLLEALAIRCGLDPVAAMAGLGWAAYAGLAFALALLVARFAFPGRPLTAGALSVLLAASAPLVCWAGSGMETCLYAALLLASLLLALGTPERGRPAASAAALVLAALTRPEAAALAPVWMWIVYRREGALAPALRHGAIFGAGFGVYFAARAAHFGQLFPNTFYAKLDYGSAELFARGADYAAGFALAVPLLFALAGLALVLRPGPPLWVRACAAISAAQLLVVAYEGGDHFAMYRFAAPVVPFLGALALYPCARLAGSVPRGGAPLAALTAGALLLLSDAGLLRSVKRDEPRRPSQLERFVREVQLAALWSELGECLAGHARPGASLATIAVGAVGYHSGLALVDPHGLLDPAIARQDRPLGAGRAGHEKFDPARVLSRRPDYLLIDNYPRPRPPAESELPGLVWGDFNRALLEAPELSRGYAYRPLRCGERYWSLHVRRDAPGLDAGPGL